MRTRVGRAWDEASEKIYQALPLLFSAGSKVTYKKEGEAGNESMKDIVCTLLLSQEIWFTTPLHMTNKKNLVLYHTQ